MDVMEATNTRIKFKMLQPEGVQRLEKKKKREMLWDLHSLTYSQLTQT